MAHTVQGQIALLYGKGVARFLPQLVGAWLAGIYDNDKSISRAAQESFKLVFPSKEKYDGVWRLYQSDIVAYISNLIEKESPTTLSDERTTTPDDAMSKYTRSLGSVIMMLTHLIGMICIHSASNHYLTFLRVSAKLTCDQELDRCTRVAKFQQSLEARIILRCLCSSINLQATCCVT